MYDMDARTPAERMSFGMESEGFYYPEMPVSAVRASPSRYDRNARVIAKAGLENILVQIYEEGDYAFEAEGKERIARAGDIAVFDLTRRSLITSNASSNICLIVPRHLLMPLTAGLDHIHGLVLPKGSAQNNLLASHMRLLVTEAPRLGVASAVIMTKATAALTAACIGNSSDARDATKQTVSTAVLREIRRTIEDRLGDDELTPEKLAGEYKLSRSALYRMFEPLGGVQNYIQQRRLMRIHQEVSDPASFHEGIAVVAQRWGFGNTAVFSRAYRALYGQSPSEARAAARRGLNDGGPSREESGGSFADVYSWLYGIAGPTKAPPKTSSSRRD